MPETRQRPEHACPVCYLFECGCECETCVEARARRAQENATPHSEFHRMMGHALAEAGRQPPDGPDDERLRLLLVIDAEAGSDHADREAERLGLTIQLAVARERRAVRGDTR